MTLGEKIAVVVLVWGAIAGGVALRMLNKPLTPPDDEPTALLGVVSPQAER